MTIEANEADLWVHKGKSTIALIEVLNWNKKGWLAKQRADKIIENLICISGNRFLVCSFPENVAKYINKLHENRIHVIYIGFQTLPVDIYEHEVPSPEIANEKGIIPQSKEILSILEEKLLQLKDLEDDPKISWKEFTRRMREKKIN